MGIKFFHEFESPVQNRVKRSHLSIRMRESENEKRAKMSDNDHLDVCIFAKLLQEAEEVLFLS